MLTNFSNLEMGKDNLQTLEIIEVMENFLERNRPPENLRHQLDVGYEIVGQTVSIYEIRPRPDSSKEIMHSAIAKTTFVKIKNYWQVYWQRANLKWNIYKPKPSVKTIKEFVELVEGDKYGCFWG